MLEIYLDNDVDHFEVGDFLYELKGFNLYRLYDRLGRFRSFGLINKAHITEIIEKTDYLNLIGQFQTFNNEEKSSLPDDFKLNNIENTLVTFTLVSEPDFVKIARVEEVSDLGIKLSRVETPSFESVNEALAVPLVEFEQIEFYSTEQILLERFLKSEL